MQSLRTALDVRQKAGNLRDLHIIDGIDFCSNDYLGLARFSLDVKQMGSGSTGSRLISGHDLSLEQLEYDIASFHGFESALLFSSGYAANTGLMSCIAGTEDAILSDELIHASLIDGIRLSYAKRKRFLHNDLVGLETQLAALTETVDGQIFVVVESLYSMDGGIAPLVEISKICQQFDAALIVDEAHSVGVYGDEGCGLVNELGLEEQIFAAIHTYGKAVGFHGASIVGSSVLREYLINFCRPFIYTTAPSPQTIAATTLAYTRFKEANKNREALRDILKYFTETVKVFDFENTLWLDSDSPVQGLIIPGNEYAKALQSHLRKDGFAVKAILSPTVAEGSERIRFCLHSFNTREQVDMLVASLLSFFKG